jgi:phosphatidylethanolamine/phosphatidyl-N-methylethanolamine N-methyltransferase
VPLSRGIGWLAPVYDRLTAPFEHRSFAGWRESAWARVPDGGLGLEIGAGTGANFPYYPAGARVIATDISDRMLGQAREKPDRQGAPLVACDVQDLPFRDRSFDWAAVTLVFCEVPDPVAGLCELRRVLKPTGRLVMLEHVRPSGWLGRAADALTSVTAPLWGEHFDRDAEAAASASGFRVEQREWLWRDGVVLLVLAPAVVIHPTGLAQPG